MVGSSIEFEDSGERQLKGVPGVLDILIVRLSRRIVRVKSWVVHRWG
jgi:hypothetical protein